MNMETKNPFLAYCTKHHDLMKTFSFQPMEDHIHQLWLQFLHIFFHVDGNFVLHLWIKTMGKSRDVLLFFPQTPWLVPKEWEVHDDDDDDDDDA